MGILSSDFFTIIILIAFFVLAYFYLKNNAYIETMDNLNRLFPDTTKKEINTEDATIKTNIRKKCTCEYY